jgi:molecular chaperone IbpA
MTNLLNYRPSFIGLDKILNDLTGATASSSFPPFNVIQVSDFDYVIELAIAGYAKSEIEITVDKNILSVVGKKREENTSNFLYKGISSKFFERKFAISNTVVVKKAEQVDGLLRIYLFNDVQFKSSAIKISVE